MRRVRRCEPRERRWASLSLADADLAIETANGVVRPTGRVDDAGDRLTALTIARDSPGMKSVVDDITPGMAH